MKSEIKTDVAIIGAGISGLTAAHFLSKSGKSVVVLEKNNRIGGSIHSEKRDGFLIEHGPNSTLETTPILGELFADLNLQSQLQYATETANKRYIVRYGKLNALPASPPAFIKSNLFSASAKLRLLKEPFIKPAPPEKDESLGAFVQRRLGQEFLDYAINPFVAGVYAGKPETLCIKSAFPKLHQLEQEYGSLIKGAILGARKRKKSAEKAKSHAKMLSFQNGLQTVTDAIGKSLAKQIFTETAIMSIRRDGQQFEIDVQSPDGESHISATTLLLTIPAHQYEKLPFEFDFPLQGQFEDIYYPPVSMVYFGYKKQPDCVPLDGFGFLVPEKEQRQILGTLWSSSIFPGRMPDGGAALTTFVGGSRQPENALLPDEQLSELVQNDLRELMGISQKPDVVVIRKWQKAIPQYRLGHQQLMRDIELFEQKNPGMFISGNFRGGISVADCVKQAHGMSETISRFLVENNKVALETA